MFTVKIADLIIAIDNKYDYVESLCAQYKCDATYIDFTVYATEKEIENERNIGYTSSNDAYLESICIYRNIAIQLPKYDAFVMHCAAIEYNGNAFCFAAKSGTGKTTHIKLWRKVYGKKIKIINGDKPIFRLKNNSLFVYGTPWSGKENYNRNASAPLKSICFIQQASENSIIKLAQHQALNRILYQVYFPDDSDLTLKTIDLVGKLLEQASLWQLNCNISEEAAMLSFKSMTTKD